MPITFGAIKYGNDSDNEIYGTTSDDMIFAYGGNDYVDAGDGDDYVDAGDGDDYVYAGEGNDYVLGGDGNDRLVGGTGDDQLFGGNGNDIFWGGGGTDKLDGGAGNDQLAQGEFMTGGLGFDVFLMGMYRSKYDLNYVYSTPAAPEFITDFSHAQADKIDVSQLDANELVAANQQFSFIGNGAFTGQAGQLRYEFHDSYIDYTAVQGDMDGDGIADLHVNVAGWINFTASDFLL